MQHSRLVKKCLLVVVGMFGFGFLMIPIYNTMCQTLGINGKTNNQAIIYHLDTLVDKSRTVTVEFLATNNAQIPWEFKPSVKKIKLHPGEIKKINFFAHNRSEKTMTAQAIPSVTPSLAARYLKKTECFCFEQQTLKPDESIDMPLLFHLDPELPKRIKTLTLSYTLFDVTGRHIRKNKPLGKIS